MTRRELALWAAETPPPPSWQEVAVTLGFFVLLGFTAWLISRDDRR